MGRNVIVHLVRRWSSRSPGGLRRSGSVADFSFVALVVALVVVVVKPTSLNGRPQAGELSDAIVKALNAAR